MDHQFSRFKTPRRRPTCRNFDIHAILLLLATALSAALAIYFFAVQTNNLNAFDYLDISPRAGAEGQYQDTVGLQQYIDKRRTEIAGVKGLPNPVGKYVAPTCENKILPIATGADLCLDGRENDAQFMLVQLNYINVSLAVPTVSTLTLLLIGVILMLAIGRQKCLNEAISVKKAILQLSSLETEVSRQNDGNNSALMSGGGGRPPRTPLGGAPRQHFSPDSPTATVNATAALEKIKAHKAELVQYLAQIPPFECVIEGTTFSSMLMLLWSLGSVVAGLVNAMLVSTQRQTISYFIDHSTVPELVEYWENVLSIFDTTMLFFLLTAWWPIVLVTTDVAFFLVGVIPYNLYRWRCGDKKKEKQELRPAGGCESSRQSNYFTGAARSAAAARDRMPDDEEAAKMKQLEESNRRGNKNGATRHKFSRVEDLGMKDRLDVFFTEWRLADRFFFAPRIWLWLTGKDRPFFNATCCDCMRIPQPPPPPPGSVNSSRRAGSLIKSRSSAAGGSGSRIEMREHHVSAAAPVVVTPANASHPTPDIAAVAVNVDDDDDVSTPREVEHPPEQQKLSTTDRKHAQDPPPQQQQLPSPRSSITNSADHSPPPTGKFPHRGFYTM